MQITVKLFATFRDGRFKIKEYDLPEGTTILEVITPLNITPEEIAILYRNGKDAKPETVLVDGDTLALFPPVGGG